MNLDTFLKWATPIGAVIAFLFGIYQWSDARQRDIEQKKFEQFHRAFEWVAGRTATGQLLADTQQAMAIYELTHFPEYKDISVPILDYYIDQTANEDDYSLFRKALLHARSQLEPEAVESNPPSTQCR